MDGGNRFGGTTGTGEDDSDTCADDVQAEDVDDVDVRADDEPD